MQKEPALLFTRKEHKCLKVYGFGGQEHKVKGQAHECGQGTSIVHATLTSETTIKKKKTTICFQLSVI